MGGGDWLGNDDPLYRGVLHAKSELGDAALAGLFTGEYERSSAHEDPAGIGQIAVG